MPELPEVEAARRAIEENCVGKKIKKAIIANDTKVIDGVSPTDFQAALLGKTLISALRKGKNLWLRLNSPPFPSFQFGMTGAIYIKGVAVTKYKRSVVKDDEEWPSKFSKLFIELDDGLELSFTDKRRFARVRLLKDPSSVPPISELGPDALLEPMTVDELCESLAKKKIAMKSLLLDQSFIAGIGNWVADEVLYQARIHPLQIASSLSKEKCATLNKCIKEVIEKAVEVGADSIQYPSNWIFHSREKKPGKAFVDGKKIDFITAGGRTTAYVPDLQKLTGNQVVKAVDQPRKRTAKRKAGGEDNNDDDVANEPASEEEEKAKTATSKRPKPGHDKKSLTRRKSKANDDDNEVDRENDDASEPVTEEEENTTRAKSKRALKPKGGSKKLTIRGKSEPSHDESGDDNHNNKEEAEEEEKDDQQKKLGRVTSRKQAHKDVASKKRVTGQNGKRLKKKAS